MVVNERAAKRARRKVAADLPDLFTFPPPPESPEAFRDNVRGFLGRHARVTLPSSSLFPSLLTWQIALRVDPAVVLPLDIVEEDVTRSRRSVYCDQCRVVGWSGHPVCRKRYHFIIRSNAESCDSETPFQFQQQQPQQEKWCNSISATAAEDTADDVEEWAYNQLHDNTHLLHAVVHSNGFAHLLTLNGRQGGSTTLSGRHILDLWDRLCQALSVRKVSVMDVSKKYGMEYRLLHAVTHGRSWYGNWGYEFRSGSYALTQDSYHKAVETISTLPLHPFQFQPRRPRTRLQSVIAFYQSFSDARLQTTKDLFTFMLSLIPKSHAPTASKKPKHDTSNVLCVWTANDVQHVQQAMIKLLSAVREPNWVSKRALRGALYKTFSPELLDYSLKHLGGQLVANNMVIETRCNPDSTDVEYRLEPLTVGRSELKPNFPPEQQILGDLKFLYDSILHPDTMLSYAPQAVRENVVDAATKLLDCKQFIKDFKPDKMLAADPSGIHLWCHVQLSDHPKDDFVLPPELIVLPLNATLADLKSEATKAFQEVYAMFKRFEVVELFGCGSINDSITAKLLVGTTGSVDMKGKCPAKHGLNRFRMERGIESWIVDCICGTKDDDGERMLACDTCGVWQHTRCAGIHCSDEIPAKFVCLICMSSYREKNQSTCDSAKEANCVPLSNTTCRAKAAGPDVASNLNMTSSVR
ncbi:putative chromatin regulator PHD family [Rosa chinensis]|uniref:Putative chromatin regulator PHD family n=1 Tax=Rosa chinensis TaxID=74649 RepID=A0A2P6PKC9_ROSCH|nr:PHD finger protein At1g33420 [Rosa chinensis]PRQ22369.1 putative chromatin regulator PHD family [Rosa chinensis]